MEERKLKKERRRSGNISPHVRPISKELKFVIYYLIFILDKFVVVIPNSNMCFLYVTNKAYDRGGTDIKESVGGRAKMQCFHLKPFLCYTLLCLSLSKWQKKSNLCS
jgi:hypothetical protein